MSTDPLISFVVPCYKLAHLLPQCVSSILGQDYQDFEVLIMDNCSPDDTPQVAQSFGDSRVRHVRNETNLGHIGNYNKGISLARGKYVWVLSADDILRSPLVLGRFVDVMERNPSIGFVYCRAVELHGGEEAGIARWADSGNEDRIWNDHSFLLHLLKDNSIVFSSVLVRKECYSKVGVFQTDMPFACDWHMWCMLALHYDVAYLSEPMVCCRFHEESLTSLYFRDYVRVCVADELCVLWRVGRQAELANISTIRDACEAAFGERAYQLLLAPLKVISPHMSVAEFEEILQSRIRDEEGIKHVRTFVYTRLAEQVTADLYGNNAHISTADEIGVLWNMGQQAKAADVPYLRAACEAVFLQRAVPLLRDGLGGGPQGLSVAEFDELLRSHISDLESIKEAQVLVYTTLADQLYSGGEYAKARQSYRLGLSAHPWRLKTWGKYLLLHTGVIGIRIRQLAN